MNKFTICSVLTICVFAAQAQASLNTILPAFHDASTLIESTGDTGGNFAAFLVSGSGTLAPTFGDTVLMTGQAGYAGRADTESGNVWVNRIGQTGLSVDLGGSTQLSVIAHNDNDDIWGAGLWVETAVDGIVLGSITDILGSGSTALITLDLSTLTGPVTGYGVLIRGNMTNADGNPSPGDGFHMSFSAVPEPATIAVWSALGAIGFLAYRRRQLA